MSVPYREGYLKHPGYGNVKLGKAVAPDQNAASFRKGPSTSLAGYRPDLGHYVRSTCEANVARCLLIQGRDYKYEPKSFPLEVTIGKGTIFKSDQVSYTPDFFVPDTNDYIEVKGRWKPESIGKKGLIKLTMFCEQYPHEDIVLIQTYDYRKDFPGVDLDFKEEIMMHMMENIFGVPIKEHSDLFWWENGTQESGYNIETCPPYPTILFMMRS